MNTLPFLTIDHKRKISESMKGKQNHKGHKHNEEAKVRMKEAWKRRKDRTCGLTKKEWDELSDIGKLNAEVAYRESL